MYVQVNRSCNIHPIYSIYIYLYTVHHCLEILLPMSVQRMACLLNQSLMWFTVGAELKKTTTLNDQLFKVHTLLHDS